MAIQNPHSNTPGKMPHLTPGEIGVNKADDVLWFRSQGRRVPIILGELDRHAPMDGYRGAALTLEDGKPVWDASLAPSSVVNGVVAVEMPPGSGLFAVPGVMITDLGADRALVANDVEVSPFYIRSDAIRITHLSFAVRSGSAAVRVGIVDALGIVQADVLVSSPAAGANSVTLSSPLTLPRGAYRTILGAQGALTVGVITSLRQEQGWDIISDVPSFVHGWTGTKDMTSGIGSLPALTARRTGAPGLDHTVLIGWTTP